MLNKFKLFISAILCSFVIAIPSSATPVLHINNDGILVGATQILVEGKLFDVQFRDGECGGIDHLCDYPSNFMFKTSLSARAASQALLDQIFLGVYDTDYALTNGCQNLIEDRFMCAILTPYDSVSIDPYIFIHTEAVFNATTNSLQSFGLLGTDSTKTIWDYTTYAIWTECIDVPEPHPIPLVILSLTFIWLRHRLIK